MGIKQQETLLPEEKISSLCVEKSSLKWIGVRSLTYFILLPVPPCGGMGVYLEKTLYKVTFSARAPRWFPPFAPQLFSWCG